MPSGQISNSNDAVTNCPFLKAKANAFGTNPELIRISLAPLISGERGRLTAAEQLLPSFALGNDCSTSH